MDCPEGGCLTFQFLPNKQARAERKSDPICRKVGGGGTCMRPGRGSNNGQLKAAKIIKNSYHPGNGLFFLSTIFVLSTSASGA